MEDFERIKELGRGSFGAAILVKGTIFFDWKMS